MSYFDIKQKHYADILHMVDKTITSGGDIKNIRENVVKLMNELEKIKSQIWAHLLQNKNTYN